MKDILLILISNLIGQVVFAQERIESRQVLDSYENGQTHREQVKYYDNDTVVELTYFEDGQLNIKRQILHKQRNGWSYTYNENGELIFHENYVNNNLSGEVKCFYPNGKTSRVESFRENKLIDTSTYFNENSQIIKTVIYTSPCEFGSRECNKVVTIYDEASKIYAYQVNDGIKSENHIIYNQNAYDQLMELANKIPIHEQGKTIFINNCGMCHGLDKPLIGPSLNCITKTKSKTELTKLIGGKNRHPISKLTEKEIQALIEFLKKNCP